MSTARLPNPSSKTAQCSKPPTVNILGSDWASESQTGPTPRNEVVLALSTTILGEVALIITTAGVVPWTSLGWAARRSSSALDERRSGHRSGSNCVSNRSSSFGQGIVLANTAVLGEIALIIATADVAGGASSGGAAGRIREAVD